MKNTTLLYPQKSKFQKINFGIAIILIITFASVLPFTLGSEEVNEEEMFIEDFIYSTYIGGSLNDAIRDVKIDSEGNILLIGITTSEDIPTTENAFQSTYYTVFF